MTNNTIPHILTDNLFDKVWDDGYSAGKQDGETIERKDFPAYCCRVFILSDYTDTWNTLDDAAWDEVYKVWKSGENDGLWDDHNRNFA